MDKTLPKRSGQDFLHKRANRGIIPPYSRNARAEAIRNGAPAIDLVDGQELAELLKRYELGVKTVVVEKVVVDWEWFERI